MEVHGLETILQTQPLFKNMSSDIVTTISGCGKNVRFPLGHVLAREGDEANEFYLIREGEVRVYVSSPKLGPITLQTLGPGEILGWSWLFPPYQWYFDARVTKPVRAISFDGKCLRNKCEKDPALGYNFMKSFASILINRLQATRLQLLEALEEKELR